jgi:hypothetical protein
MDFTDDTRVGERRGLDAEEHTCSGAEQNCQPDVNNSSFNTGNNHTLAGRQLTHTSLLNSYSASARAPR